MSSGGIERGQWHEMGQKLIIYNQPSYNQSTTSSGKS